VSVIHAFRMPVFFILAGFFAVLLAQSRGVQGMVKNRVLRLALPFALFWPFIWVACGLAGLAFLNRMSLGRWGLDDSLAAVPAWVPRGPNTMHLWFIWQLLWFCLLAGLAMRLPRHWFAPAAAWLYRLGRSPWGFAVLAIPLMLAGMGYERGILRPSGFFVPPWSEWVHNGIFFAFGLMLFGHRDELFALYRRQWRRLAVGGLVMYAATGLVDRFLAQAWATAYAYNCVTWLWSFALIGLALQAFARQQKFLQYLADSAYWVYLLHMPLTIAFGALLFGIPLPAMLKIVANIGATTVVCLATYAVFVRHTWVSVLLNGKRHPKGGAPPAAAAAAG